MYCNGGGAITQVTHVLFVLVGSAFVTMFVVWIMVMVDEWENAKKDAEIDRTFTEFEGTNEKTSNLITECEKQ